MDPVAATTSDCRRVHNRDIIKRVAIEEGFEVDLRDFQDSKGHEMRPRTLEEQMEDVAEFDVLMARHGAGHTWSYMLPSHGVVVEMVAKGGGDSKEYCVRWDPIDPHYHLFMNWAVNAGLAYISWESSKISDESLWMKTKKGGDRRGDWKHGVFEVDEEDAKEHVRRVKSALFANAGCPGATMPDKVAHYKLGNYTPPARNFDLDKSRHPWIKSSKSGCNRR